MPNISDATLLKTTGSIFVEREGERIELQEGDGIYESDTIITGPDTTADIIFRDGAKSRLSPDTELKLVDFDFGAGEDPSFIMDLAQGAMRTVSGEVVKMNPEAFELVTPRATVGIRGTEFINAVDGANETHVVLFIAEGHIMKVTNSDGQSIDLSTPLQMIQMQEGDAGPLTIQKYSMAQMESVIESLAPTLGNDFPTSEAEQGDWSTLVISDQTGFNDKAKEAQEKVEAADTVTESTVNTTTTVIIADATDANNDALLGALDKAGLVVDVVDIGLVGSQEDLLTESLVAENDSDDYNDSGYVVDNQMPDMDTDYDREDDLSGGSGNGSDPDTGGGFDPDYGIDFPDGEIISGDVNSGSDINGAVFNVSTITEDAVGNGSTVGGDFIELSGEFNGGFLTTAQDTITIKNVSESEIYGDGVSLSIESGTIQFVKDTITVEGLLLAGSKISGDIDNIDRGADTSALEFGDDNITVGYVSADSIIVGDAFEIKGTGDSSSSITFGDDKIIVDSLSGTIIGDVVSMDSGSLGAIKFGNDVITVDTLNAGGKIYGDSNNATVNGLNNDTLGHDRITITNTVNLASGTTVIDGGGGDDTITLLGGFDTSGSARLELTGGAGNDTFYINIADSEGNITFTDFGTGNDKITLTSSAGFDRTPVGYSESGTSLVVEFENGTTFTFENVNFGTGTAEDYYNAHIKGDISFVN